jgi:hypothetical protein
MVSPAVKPRPANFSGSRKRWDILFGDPEHDTPGEAAEFSE